MKIYYDTEFVDDGKTIDLISIGAVAENGEEFYRASHEFDWRAASRHKFVAPYVLPYLPGGWDPKYKPIGGLWVPDLTDPLYASRDEIADELRDWLWDLGGHDYDEGGDSPLSLWAYYAAYDHVALAQFFGPMSAMPRWLPHRTNDLAQRMETLGVTEDQLPVQDEGHHRALDDARWNLKVDRYLDEQAGLVQPHRAIHARKEVFDFPEPRSSWTLVSSEPEGFGDSPVVQASSVTGRDLTASMISVVANRHQIKVGLAPKELLGLSKELPAVPVRFVVTS